MVSVMNKKVVAVVLAAVMALCAIGASVAYLRDSTDTVSNVFTVGENIDIALDESVVDEFGVALDPVYQRTSEGNSYKLFPGVTYKKDPVLSVIGGSEKCYVYIKLAYKPDYASVIGKDAIDSQILSNGWACIKTYTEGGKDVSIYARLAAVDASDGALSFPFFSSFTVPSDIAVDSPAFQAAKGEKLELTGYAIQAAGFADAKVAWDVAGF